MSNSTALFYAQRVQLKEDILALIFQLLLDDLRLHESWPQRDATKLRLVVSSVCQLWRRAATNFPGLWRFHRLDCMRLKSRGDLTSYRARFASTLKHSRGRLHGVCILNFPGPTGTLPEAPSFWVDIITEGLVVCEQFHLLVHSGTDQHAACVRRVVESLAKCVAPRLASAVINLPTPRDGSHCSDTEAAFLFSSPATASIQKLALSGLKLSQVPRVCLHSRLTSLDYCDGFLVRNIAPVLRPHRSTLQTLRLVDVAMDDGNLLLGSLPSLRSIALSGRSVVLLLRLHTTFLPRLTDICIEHGDATATAIWLSAFLHRHFEVRTLDLTLKVPSSSEFSPFASCMTLLPHLRRLSMYGKVGAAFFARLARPVAATQPMLISLQTLEIHDHYMIEHIVSSLLLFLKRKVFLASQGLQSLRIYPPQGPTVIPPVYSTALALNQLVGEFVDELKISDRDSGDILRDVSYLVPLPHIKAFTGTILRDVLLCQILSEIVNRTCVRTYRFCA
ncbi:hypothetical protein AURDEDRAFT_161038 [Auricularia subglabra TFB-10046 SS5]|nr:hypothetical protein AURDEDRAFT_161038 [Auricularia subglabra TFB-10046 SS5]